MKLKIAISALLTIFVVFALSWLVHAQGSTGVTVVASCGAQSYAIGSVRRLTMNQTGTLC